MSNDFNSSRDLERPCNYLVMWLHGQKPLKVSHHPAKFCGHSHCCSGDLSRDFARPRDQRLVLLYRRVFPMVSHTPVKFGDDRNRGSGDVVNNFSLSRDLARPRNKRVMWLYGQEFIKVSYHPVRFDSHWGLWLWSYIFSLSCDLDVMISPGPARLVSFESTPLDVPACRIWWW